MAENPLKWMLKRLVRIAVAYELYAIYAPSRRETDSDSASSSPLLVRNLTDFDQLHRHHDDEIRTTARYERPGATAVGAWVDTELAGVAWCWSGPDLADRGWGSMPPSYVEIVQCTTARQFRCRGVASALVKFATRELQASGYSHIFARIWHSHWASRRAFERAGWTRRALFVVLRLRGCKRTARVFLTSRNIPKHHLRDLRLDQ